MTIAALALAGSLAGSLAGVAAEGRGMAFWKPLVEGCAVPEGETAWALVTEAAGLLGSPSSAWRDDVGYGVVASCVYRKRVLSHEERRALVRHLSANLLRDVGETGTDSVLLRSFSALDLSILAALETEDPALDAAGFERLVEAALGYLQAERDLRGFEPRVGWIHATAHTADLLKFLARDPRFSRANARRLLDGVAAKLLTPGTPVFTHAEEERLAAAVGSLARRADFDAGELDGWLARFVGAEKQVWTKAPPDPEALDAAQNGRSFLRSLYVLLSLPAAAGPGGSAQATTRAETLARAKVLETLSAIRR
jgi:hypothetical protein